jgi:hypothetical protein
MYSMCICHKNIYAKICCNIKINYIAKYFYIILNITQILLHYLQFYLLLCKIRTYYF